MISVKKELILVAVILTLGLGLAAATTVSYTVVVVDGVTGDPIANADVYLVNSKFGGPPPGYLTYHEITNGDGEALFPSVITTGYMLVVKAEGYGIYAERVTVTSTRRRRQIAVFSTN